MERVGGATRLGQGYGASSMAGKAARVAVERSGSCRDTMVTPLSRARQERFQSIHGVIATLRREKGHDIAAACGQLRLQTNRAERAS